MAGVSVLHSEEAYKCRVLSGKSAAECHHDCGGGIQVCKNKGMADVKHHPAWSVNM